MRFYNQPHAFYGGVDLHARSMFTHVLDAQRHHRLRTAICPPQPAGVPRRRSSRIATAWSSAASACSPGTGSPTCAKTKRIPFVLGHALSMKAIHGGKAKNDRIDAAKIAGMLRGGMFPMAYVYPRAKRETRDLLRRRCFFVRQRSQLIAHIVNTNSQYNQPPLTVKLCYPRNREEDFAERFAHPTTQLSVKADLNLIDAYEAADRRHRTARAQERQDRRPGHASASCAPIPGIGQILGLVMLYEIDQIGRFPEPGNFLSYARLVRCEHESAGKEKGSGGKKIGNAHLKWAFSRGGVPDAAGHAGGEEVAGQTRSKRGKKKALSVLEAKIGRTVYHLWRKQQAFDAKRFFA